VSRSALLGEPDGILASVSERTRRAEFRLGEPTKQNGGERRARLGRTSGRQAQQRPRESEAEYGDQRYVGIELSISGFGQEEGIGWTRICALVGVMRNESADCGVTDCRLGKETFRTAKDADVYP
jgi:hypothetical protein